MSSVGPRAIDRAFVRDIALGADGALLAEARRIDAELARQRLAERRDLVPAGELATGDVVRLDDSCRRYALRRRDAEWVFLREVDGSGLARAHVDDLVERTD